MVERTCSIDGCGRKHLARGLCGKHYQRLMVTGSTDPRPPHQPRPCEFDGCTNEHIARGWCASHYNRWKKTGDPAPAVKPPRPPCVIAECDRPSKSSITGLCQLHSDRKRRGTDLHAPLRGTPKPCSEPECDEQQVCRGLCKRHYYEIHTKPKAAIYAASARERYKQQDPVERSRKRRLHYRDNRERITEQRRAQYAENYAQDPAPWHAAKSRRKMRLAEKMSDDDKRISEDYRRAIASDPCHYCGTADAAHVDHYFPLAKGGTDHWWNLVRACQDCNMSKHARCGTWFMLKTGGASEPGIPPIVAQANPVDR